MVPGSMHPVKPASSVALLVPSHAEFRNARGTPTIPFMQVSTAQPFRHRGALAMRALHQVAGSRAGGTSTGSSAAASVRAHDAGLDHTTAELDPAEQRRRRQVQWMRRAAGMAAVTDETTARPQESDLQLAEDVRDQIYFALQQAHVISQERRHLLRLATLERQKREAGSSFLAVMSHVRLVVTLSAAVALPVPAPTRRCSACACAGDAHPAAHHHRVRISPQGHAAYRGASRLPAHAAAGRR